MARDLPSASMVYTTITRVAPPDLRAWMDARLPLIMEMIEQALVGLKEPTANPAPASVGSRTSALTRLWDAEGRVYTTRYVVLALATTDRAARKGSSLGPIVVASNLPQSWRPSPGYPPAFQARDLSEASEQAKIKRIAMQLDPDRLLAQHADPTLGPPVVWLDPSGERAFPLGGNSRSLAIATAPEESYQRYLDRLRSEWGELVPDAPAPPGTRWLLTRMVGDEQGGSLSEDDAARLAGASQAATAGAETALGRAMSVARGLGLNRLSDLPPVAWIGAVHRDNVQDFTRQNAAFWDSLLGRLDPARAQTVAGRPDAAAELIRQIFALALPPEVRSAGLGDRSEEEALLAALPALVTLHRRVQEGLVKPEWDLLPKLGAIAQGARMIAQKRLSIGKALSAWEASRQQVGMFAGKAATIFDELDPAALLFALALKQAASRADPEKAIEGYLQPYMGEALSDRQAAKQSGLFGGGPSSPAPGPGPAEMLAGAIGRSAASWGIAQRGGQAELRANPRRPSPSDLSEHARSRLRSLGGEKGILVKDQPKPKWVRELLRLRLASFEPQDSGIFTTPIGMIRISRAGLQTLADWAAQEARAFAAAQTALW